MFLLPFEEKIFALFCGLGANVELETIKKSFLRRQKERFEGARDLCGSRQETVPLCLQVVVEFLMNFRIEKFIFFRRIICKV